MSDGEMATGLEAELAAAQAMLVSRSESEGRDALIVEGEVIAACLAALVRLHETRRGGVIAYLKDRTQGFDYLELSARIATDFKARLDKECAETARLRRELAAKRDIPSTPTPIAEAKSQMPSMEWRCVCGCRNVGVGVVKCAKCGKER